MKNRARQTLSSDLDIFGTPEDSNDSGISVDDTDILPLEDSKDDTKDVKDVKDSTDVKDVKDVEDSTDVKDTESEGDTKDKGTTEEASVASGEIPDESTDTTNEDTTLTEDDNFDIGKLFDDIEKEAQDEGNDNLTGMLDELRRKVADQESELLMVRKQNEVINEKLMNRAGDDVSIGMYKPLIDNIDGDRNLKFFVANYNKQTNPKVKDKLIDVMMGFVKDLTGEDISDLITTSQNNKILGASGASSSAQPLNDGKQKDEPMSYEDSINLLF